MKKKSLGILGLGVLLLTGCGTNEKTLTCTVDQSSTLSGSGTMKGEIVVKYVDDKITEEEENLYAEITNEAVTDDMMEELKTNLKALCDQEDANFKKCDVTLDGKKIEFKSTRDIKDLSDAEIDEETPYEDAKKVLEGRGYTCTE